MTPKKTTETNHADLYVAMSEVPARVGLILHLRSMVVDDTCPAEVEDLFDDLDDADVRALWPDMPKDERDAFTRGDMLGVEMVIDERKIFGFIVRVDTPVVDKHGDYSWGWYTHRLFYADTFDDALRAGLAWAQKEHGNVRP